jgi:hypothetical protein
MARPPARLCITGGKQKAESRKQKAESRKQKAESRKQKAESRKQKAESRKQKADFIGSWLFIPDSAVDPACNATHARPDVRRFLLSGFWFEKGALRQLAG